MSIYYFFYIWEARKPDLLFADVAQVDKVTFLRFDHRKKPIKAVGSLVNGCDEMSDYFRFMQCCQKLFLQSTNYMFFGYIIIFVGFTY